MPPPGLSRLNATEQSGSESLAGFLSGLSSSIDPILKINDSVRVLSGKAPRFGAVSGNAPGGAPVTIEVPAGGGGNMFADLFRSLPQKQRDQFYSAATDDALRSQRDRLSSALNANSGTIKTLGIVAAAVVGFFVLKKVKL